MNDYRPGRATRQRKHGGLPAVAVTLAALVLAGCSGGGGSARRQSAPADQSAPNPAAASSSTVSAPTLGTDGSTPASGPVIPSYSPNPEYPHEVAAFQVVERFVNALNLRDTHGEDAELCTGVIGEVDPSVLRVAGSADPGSVQTHGSTGRGSAYLTVPINSSVLRNYLVDFDLRERNGSWCILQSRMSTPKD